jgi:hypothetical protein
MLAEVVFCPEPLSAKYSERHYQNDYTSTGGTLPRTSATDQAALHSPRCLEKTDQNRGQASD